MFLERREVWFHLKSHLEKLFKNSLKISILNKKRMKDIKISIIFYIFVEK